MISVDDSHHDTAPVGLPLLHVERSCECAVNSTQLDWPHGATTAMLRNIASRYTPEEIMADMNSAGFSNQYDFLYLPIDFKTKRNLGYGFVNFTSVEAAHRFFRTFDNTRLERYVTRKVLKVSPAVTQGLEDNVAKLQNCAILLEGA